MQATLNQSEVATQTTLAGLKFKARTSSLLRSASQALSVVPKKSPIPSSLSGLLIEGKGDQIAISANDLSRALTVHCKAEIESEGVVLLPARTLVDYLGCLDSEHIAFHHTAKREHQQVVEVSCGSNRGRLFGFEPGDFPEIPRVESEQRATVNARLLQIALKAALGATARNEFRPTLSAVRIETLEAGFVTTAGADGFRLAEHTVQIEYGEPFEMLVSRNAVVLLLSLIGAKPSGDVELIAGSKSMCEFRLGETVLTSRIREGVFPDYKKLIPDATPTHVTCPGAQLIAAVKAALVFAKSNSNITILRAGDDGLGISAKGAEHGETGVTVEGEFDGEPGEIAFNGKCLQDALVSLSRLREPPARVVLHFRSANDPLLITAEDSELAERHLIMPMHVAR